MIKNMLKIVIIAFFCSSTITGMTRQRAVSHMDMLSAQLVALGSGEKKEALNKQLIDLCRIERGRDEKSLRPVRNLLVLGADANTSSGMRNSTVLHFACGTGNKALVELLLEFGANPDQEDINGIQPLHVAIDTKNEEICTLLIEKGIDQSKKSGEWPALISAVIRKDLPMCQFLLKSHYKSVYSFVHRKNPNALTKALTAALAVAVENNCLEFCTLLLDHGANLKSIDINGWTALFLAVQHGHLEVSQLLLARGIDLNARDNNGRTILFEAAHRGHLEICKLLVDGGAEVNHTCRVGRTALFGAAHKCSREICALLIEKGADPDHKDRGGRSARSVAAEAGYREFEQLFPPKNARLSNRTRIPAPKTSSSGTIKPQHKVTGKRSAEYDEELRNVRHAVAPLEAVIERPVADRSRETDTLNGQLIELCSDDMGQDERSLNPVKNLLIRATNTNVLGSNAISTALHCACNYGNKALVGLLLEYGADPDSEDREGRAPLDRGLEKKNWEICKLLCEKGIRLIRERGEWTALNRAAKKGDLVACQLLIKQENILATRLDYLRNANALKKALTEAFLIAVQLGHQELCKLLLTNGANLNFKDIQGRSALFIAAQRGYVDLCRLLLAQGIDCRAKDNLGRTALFEVAYGGYTEITKLLLEKGVAVNEKSRDGRTALFGAALRGHREICQLFIDWGADLNCQDSQRLSPLSLATEGEHEELCQLLIDNGAQLFDDSARVSQSQEEQPGFFQALYGLFSQLG